MQKLFKEQKVSLYKIQKDLGLEIKRLYRYADGTCKIESMPMGLLKKLAEYFDTRPQYLYDRMIQYEKEKEL